MSASGLYVHIPFCSRVCPYCDFAVRTGGPRRRAEFLEAVLREIREVEWSGAPFDTIYLGGGTPSALGPEQLRRILDALREELPLEADPWLTLEANPEDVSPEAAADWQQLGVSTLSLGVQSFDDDSLRFLGRRHAREDSIQAAETARAAGFPIVSIDLILGLPGQDEAAWRRELDCAVALGPHHISCYQLTIHDGTLFGKLRDRGRLSEMPDAEQSELFELTHSVLGEHEFTGYEVSNFARGPRSESRHNLKYWRHVPYLGIGPSAHSFDGSRRWWNHRRLEDWREAVARGGSGVEEAETLRPRDIALEALIMGLRTRAGVDLDWILERTGIDLLRANRERLAAMQQQNLCTVDGAVVRPSVRGMLVAEWMVRELRIEDA